MRPDGTPVFEDPRVTARRIDLESPDWTIWYGRATGRFWAMSSDRELPLVEALTPGDLVARMSWARTARRT
jgi:hypothetical protein